MLSVIAGAAPADDTTVPVPPGDLVAGAASPGDLAGLRVAYSPDLGGLPVDPDVREVFAAALEVVAGLGATLVAAAPATADPTAMWNTIALAEGYASEGPLLARWRSAMSPGTAAIIEAGAGITAGRYVDALHERSAYTRVWADFFTGHDVLLTPTMQMTAFEVGRLGPAAIEGRPVDPFFDDWCTLCLPANLTGMPATSVPVGVGRDGLPVGLQVMGPRWSDALTLRVAAAVESEMQRRGR
jgi:Asp-tRNA(Asn)/Glu-tRNA(Gln) amidotransferase A subunit family amidase